MATTDYGSAARARRAAYGVLIAASLGQVAGDIAAVDSIDRQQLARQRQREGRADWQLNRPFLSANDRSRWCTIRALVERGTYAIDEIQAEPNWDTIDMVKHDGRLYSSKPPLLPTLLAAPYWVIHRLSGKSLGTHPYEIGRFLLFLYNLLPLACYFLILTRWAERYGASDWGRVFVVAAGTLGTLLTTFGSTLNNHLPAAFFTAVAWDGALRIALEGRRRLGWFALVGFSAAMAAACELPALVLVAALAAVLTACNLSAALRGAAPAALLVVAGFFGTNWAAHGTLLPAYAQRGETENWYDYTYHRNGRELESYWRNRVGIDRGEPSRARYALHVLVGHHGIVSLTPIWLVSLAAAVYRPQRRVAAWLAATIAAMTGVCLLFYLGRGLEDRNYGGLTSGFRWMFWLAPLWLWVMLPPADRIGQSRHVWPRGLALVALALSALSASYSWNPWSHPWLWNLMHYLGWVAD